MRVLDLVFAGSSLDKARRIFERYLSAPATDPADNSATDARAAATPSTMKQLAIAFALVFERSAGTTEGARTIRRTRVRAVTSRAKSDVATLTASSAAKTLRVRPARRERENRSPVPRLCHRRRGPMGSKGIDASPSILRTVAVTASKCIRTAATTWWSVVS